MLELAGLLKSGMPSGETRRLFEGKLEKLTPVARAQFEAIWSLASRNGGSLAAAIEAFGNALRELESHRAAAEAAFAGPKSTARLVSWLPPIGLLLGQIIGMNPLGVMFQNRLAFISVALAVILLVAGRIWSKRIVRRANPAQDDPGLFFDAVRLGVNAGLPLSTAITDVVKCFEMQDLGFERAEGAMENIANLNRSRGASVSDLLFSAARTARVTRWLAEDEKVAQLGVSLMVPLGLVTLPAFVLGTIVPISFGLLASR